MQTLDIIIFTVILTAVSLACAQSTLLNLSDKADEVPLVNKIIGMLGLCSAGFALFFSRIFIRKFPEMYFELRRFSRKFYRNFRKI